MFVLQILLNSLVSGTQVLLLAAALYLIYSVCRVYHIGLSGILVSGAYLSYFFIPFLGIIGGVVSGIIGSAILGFLHYRLLLPFLQEKKELLALLVSIALWLLHQAVLALSFGSGGKFLFDDVLKTYNFGGIFLTEVGVYTLLLGIGCTVTFWTLFQMFPFGLAVRAIAQHPECASLMGIKVQRVQRFIFLIAGALSGCIGILTGMNNGISPTAGSDPVILAFVALLVGGVHSFRGMVLASYLFVLLPEIFISFSVGGFNFSEAWRLVIVFLFAFFILLLKPKGLFHISVRKT